MSYSQQQAVPPVCIEPHAIVLATLAGNDYHMPANLAHYDDLSQLEDDVASFLPTVSDIEVFGCEVDLIVPDTQCHCEIHPTMQTYLDDPIWEVLQKNTQFTIVLRDCLAEESFDGCPYRDFPQAIQVPMNLAGIIPAGAFVAVPRLRHVSVEAGMFW